MIDRVCVGNTQNVLIAQVPGVMDDHETTPGIP